MTAAALLSAAYALCAPARAGTDTDTMTVSATVVASCDVVANDLDFVTYDPVSGSPVDASTTLEITCTNGTAYVVALDEGVGAGATIAARRMTSGGDSLTYNLYTDAARTTIWGDGTSGTSTVTLTNSFSLLTWSVSAPVYGRAPSQPTAHAGSYSDTVLVTVEW